MSLNLLLMASRRFAAVIPDPEPPVDPPIDPPIAIEYVNGWAPAAHSGGTPTGSISLPAQDHTTGNSIVVAVRSVNVAGGTPVAVSSVTDTAGNTYSRAGAAEVNDTIATTEVWLASGIAGHAANIVTIEFASDTQYARATVAQYTGAIEYSASGALAVDGSVALSHSGGTVTTVAADELVFGSVFSYAGDDTGAGSITGIGGTTVQAYASSGGTYAVIADLPAPTAGDYALTINSGATCGVLIITRSFKAAGESQAYYVDITGSNAADGSAVAPWRTIGYAVSQAVAGDTVIVRAGNYGEKLNSVRSGGGGRRITFMAQGTVVIKSFNVDHAHITVDGFEMTGANDGHMLTLTASYCILANNVIHDTGASWGVVRMDGDSITGCVFRGNRYYSSTGPGDDLAVFIVNGNNNLIEGNEIGPAKDIDAFRVWGTNNVIRGNYIHDVTISSGSSAHIDVIQTFGLGGAISQNIVFERNLVVNFDGQICMTESNGLSGVHDWDVRNNVFANVTLQANVGIPNFRFYNNTLYDVGAANNLVMYLYDDPGKSDFSGAKIMNNVFVASSGISGYGSVMSVGSSGSSVVISHNYVASITGFGALSGWSETGGINGGDPKFVNAASGDFRLQSSSPLVDQGTASLAPATDYDGVARPHGSAPDMGAFEFVGT